MTFKRVFLIVCDSLGIGSDTEAINYGDDGANTIKHIADKLNGINIKEMESLGIGNIIDIKGVKRIEPKNGFYGKCHEASVGKDTLTGHWEMMGIKTIKPFKTFTKNGFPKELIDLLILKTGHKIIGNYAASGTEILKELGEESIKSGAMIVYTSEDSVLQIAAHEKYFGLEELYRCCNIAREICMDEKYMVGRVIARPFIGEDKMSFTRTPNRHDYAVSPTSKTVLDSLKENGYDVIAIGKINDIFNGMGITDSIKTISNNDGMEKNLELLNKDFIGLCFTNLVDFDAKYGHRRNVLGYHNAILEFDKELSKLIKKLKDDDLLIITADHGNDPTWKGTDHTREYVPLLVYNNKISHGSLGLRTSFADIGATIAENFKVNNPGIGISFLKEITK